VITYLDLLTRPILPSKGQSLPPFLVSIGAQAQGLIVSVKGNIFGTGKVLKVVPGSLEGELSGTTL